MTLICFVKGMVWLMRYEVESVEKGSRAQRWRMGIKKAPARLDEGLSRGGIVMWGMEVKLTSPLLSLD